MRNSVLTVLFLSVTLFCSCGETLNTDRVVSNPIDLNYAFNVQQSSGAREAADPVVQIYKGKYYLFPSKSKGYWHSEDMQHWTYVPCSVLPIDLYAPTVMVYKDELYWMVSDINELYKSTHPEDGSSWQLVTDHLVPYPDQPGRTVHDPDIFPDDDGRVYLYWGCSNVDVISGIELDPANDFAPIGKEVQLIPHRENEFGWEQRGDNNERPEPGYNEGPNIFKYDGRYYLQYASPGTEFDSYGDGLYVSDKPLGPYEHAEYSPISVKPAGWMTGAGHGDTFQDKYGNWWHVASTVISQRILFERRIGFYPMVMTPKGHIYAMTEWSDYPYVLPDGPQDFSQKTPWTGWMDLSIHKEVSASSELKGYEAGKAADNTIKTWWSAASGEPGEWFCLDMGRPCRVNAVQTNFADQDFGFWGEGQTPYKYVIEASKDGEKWKMLFDKRDNEVDNPHQLLVLPKAIKARYIRISNCEKLTGKFSIFDLRVFGKAPGKAPASVNDFTIDRSTDPRRIKVSWPATERAQGYVLHWGTDPDELYLSCQSEKPEVELGLFSVGQTYYFRVDSFNESGVTSGSSTQAL